MFGTRQLRASALGFGLAVLISAPAPDGSIVIPDTYEALMSYPFMESEGMPEVICAEGEAIETLRADGEHVDTLTADVTYKFNC